MTILAASVCTKSGKVLISRQFHDMPRSRIEGLMASFPKLIHSGTQHTTIEADHVRFVYQPLDQQLYLILTTSKLSNILQDIASLHLFARVISEHCRGSLSEQEILHHAFELIHAFDELVCLGYRDNVNLIQLRTITAMESNEERIQEMILKNKEMEAKEHTKLKVKQMEIQRKLNAKLNAATSGMGGPGLNMFGSSSMAMGNSNTYPINTFSSSSSSSSPSSSIMNSFTPSSTLSNNSPTSGTKTGMKLGGGKLNSTTTDVFGGMTTMTSSTPPLDPKVNSLSTITTTTTTISNHHVPSSITKPIPKDPVHLDMIEHVTVIMNQIGGLQTMEVTGDFSVHVTQSGTPTQARISINIPKTNQQPGGVVQYKTHPNMDKSIWNDNNTLVLRDVSKSYIVGQSSSVLKWRMVSTDESHVPLMINCWPNPTGNSCSVNIEFELLASHMILNNVIMIIPLPNGSSSSPVIHHVDGTTQFDHNQNVLQWHIPQVSQSQLNSGNLEFMVTVGITNNIVPAQFYPITVSWVSETLLCPLQVSMVTGPSPDHVPIEYGVAKMCIPDEYKVV